MAPKQLPPLRPAPPRPAHIVLPKKTSFYDLPAELRIEIYRLAFARMTLHILPPNPNKAPSIHSLLQVSKQVRNEALPIIHRFCPIRTNVTDLNFDGLFTFLARIPPDQFANLAKNPDLRIRLHTTSRATGSYTSINKWLHIRSDRCRPQPAWLYVGAQPETKVANQLKRKCRRMKDRIKQKEMAQMLEGMHIRINRELERDELERRAKERDDRVIEELDSEDG